METVLITGGTGLIGSTLCSALKEAGYKVIILTRDKSSEQGDSSLVYAYWDPMKKEINQEALLSADYIIHLAGANVGKGRWTQKRKKELWDSRIESTRFLYDCLQKTSGRTHTFISASAVGYYEAYSDELLTEDDPAGEDFLANLCRQWELEVQKIATLGKRVVILRTGIVLSLEGGMLLQLLQPLNLGIATIPGDGKQWISWIHIQDLVRAYLAILTNQQMNSIYNAVAPFPVTQRQFTIEMARVFKKSFYISINIPSFVLSLVLGEKKVGILKSCKASSGKLMQTGFEFQYPTIHCALQELHHHT